MRGPALRILIEYEPTGPQRAMPMDRIVVAWVLMSAQGIRRLSESLILTKPSGSKMWFVHWVLGIIFYIAMGLATWIEGAGRSLDTIYHMSETQFHDSYIRVINATVG